MLSNHCTGEMTDFISVNTNMFVCRIEPPPIEQIHSNSKSFMGTTYNCTLFKYVSDEYKLTIADSLHSCLPLMTIYRICNKLNIKETPIIFQVTRVPEVH